jgi:hypothetical protein
MRAAAVNAVKLYSNAYRLKLEFEAWSGLVQQHCYDRDVEAEYIIKTLNELQAYVKERIFTEANIAFPPIASACTGEAIQSIVYARNRAAAAARKTRAPGAASATAEPTKLGFMGDKFNAEDNGKFRGDFMFCLFAVINVAKIAQGSHEQLTKYVSTGHVKKMLYRKDYAGIRTALDAMWEGSADDAGINGRQQEKKYDVKNQALDKIETLHDLYGSIPNDDPNEALGKQIEDAVIDLCDFIDGDNASTALGVLEFMDKMAKYGMVNTICQDSAEQVLPHEDKEFPNDQLDPKIVMGAMFGQAPRA